MKKVSYLSLPMMEALLWKIIIINHIWIGKEMYFESRHSDCCAAYNMVLEFVCIPLSVLPYCRSG